jgi:hypothetical protein
MKPRQTKILIVRIKKTFRKYREFWYNGQAGTIYFVKVRDNGEYIVMAVEGQCIAGTKVKGPEAGGYFILKRHAEVIGKL